MDCDSLTAVAEDLRYLQNFGDTAQDDEIRRSSAVLRRLLVEDAFGAAWRAVGMSKEPKLVAVDIHRLIGSVPSHDVVFALAAGAKFRGLMVAGAILHRGASQDPSNASTLSEDGFPGEREYALSEFLSSASGFVNGEAFTRRDVIKYMSNIKGGVHLNAKPKKTEHKLVDRMRKIEKKIIVHRTDGLLVEIVAIAQALGRSNDAHEFISRVLGPDSGNH